MAKKDEGGWSIIKGEYTDEEPIAAAKREFKEETGFEAPDGRYLELGEVIQKNNKQVLAYAVEAALDTGKMYSNKVKIEWPPRSGNQREYPETDSYEYFDLPAAARKLIPEQAEFMERLAEKLGHKIQPGAGPEQNTLF